MVMIEAMAHALPVVAFDCPTGPRDVLTDEIDGLLVPLPGRRRAGRAVIRLIADRELRQRMGQAAVRTARDYAPETVIPMWENLFAELLRADPPASEP